MTDLDAALHEQAARWRRDEPAPPDLDAALARVSTDRSRRRWPLLVAVAACVLAVAGVAVALGLRQPARHAPLAEPSSIVTSTGHAPAALTARLRRIARSIADENGDTGTVTAEAVPTGGQWWVVQVHGTFVCNWASIAPPLKSTSPQPPTSVSVLWVHLDLSVTTRRRDGFSCTDYSRNIAQYGTVIPLGTIRSAEYPDALVAQAIDSASSNGDDHATAQAVRTSFVKAEHASDAGTDNVPDHAVWLVQLEGTFVCTACRYPPGGKAPSGRYITLIVNAVSPYKSTIFGLSNHQVDLAELGKVVTLLP